jgi:hypothetical protein
MRVNGGDDPSRGTAHNRTDRHLGDKLYIQVNGA